MGAPSLILSKGKCPWLAAPTIKRTLMLPGPLRTTFKHQSGRRVKKYLVQSTLTKHSCGNRIQVPALMPYVALPAAAVRGGQECIKFDLAQLCKSSLCCCLQAPST